MVDAHILTAVLIMSVANFITRVIPFIFFTHKEPPAFLLFIEKSFPPIIMTILIFYTLSNIDFKNELYGLKEFSAIFVTAFLHIKFNNYLVSICLGTLFYMGLTQFL
ncbi:MAG: branched-chain amino acid transporter permease [Candidatus Marinarcus sp.]|uniref:branched-chain amino acid transporter permease n=1 Tax=Candidatus Marinarcus sp. TaxID=3100987 RepID=UPI003AFFC600